MVQRAGSYVVQEQNAKLVRHRPDDPAAVAAAKVRQSPVQAAADRVEVRRGPGAFNAYTARGLVSMGVGGALIAGSVAIPLSWPFWLIGGAALFGGAVSTGFGLGHRQVERGLFNVIAGSNSATYWNANRRADAVEASLRDQGFLPGGRREPTFETSPRGLIDPNTLEGPVVADPRQLGWDPVAAGFGSALGVPGQPVQDPAERADEALARLDRSMALRAGDDGLIHEGDAEEHGVPPQGARRAPRRELVEEEPLPADDHVEHLEHADQGERVGRDDYGSLAELERDIPDDARRGFRDGGRREVADEQAAPEQGRRGTYVVVKQKGTT